MPWNDQIFRDAVEQAAHRAGKSRTAVLKEADVSTETFAHPPEFGRRIDVFEKLMPVLEWTPNDVLRLICRCFDWTAAETHIPSRGRITIELADVEISVISSGRVAKWRK